MDYLLPLLGLASLIAVGWYCRRWGMADGYAEGYAAGHSNGLVESAQASKAIGGGGEPIEPV